MVHHRFVIQAPATELTTVWTPPCGAITDASYGTTDNFPSVAHATTFKRAVKDITTTTAWDSSCGPPGWYDLHGPDNVGYFSPGICPSGYTAACTWYATEQGPNPGPEETAYNCLPYGYTCDAPYYYGDDEPFLVNQNGIHVNNMYLAPMFFIRWRSEDLSILETDPLTPEMLQTRTVVVTSTPTQPPVTTSLMASTVSGITATETQSATKTGATAPTEHSPEPAPNRVSHGAVAGIAIGSVAGVALILAAIFLLQRHRRKAHEGGHDADGDSDNAANIHSSNVLHEMCAEDKAPYHTTPAELPVDDTTVDNPSNPSLASRPAVASWLSELSSNAQDDMCGHQHRWTASPLTSASLASPASSALPVIGTELYPPPTAPVNDSELETRATA
ncbi:hypothetical protein DL546_006417 [Coniochaeta pulveracea]|uniref:Mid2 domain-containing protein n=1 Tax=Coniochaeta pulveracea TaxID=177199 RepID=A0A420YAM9_9PEZI|nr:hypothetical protein DL546_006417 [Coniochaeta pulveracea]